jgi:hypothetical protein
MGLGAKEVWRDGRGEANFSEVNEEAVRPEFSRLAIVVVLQKSVI